MKKLDVKVVEENLKIIHNNLYKYPYLEQEYKNFKSIITIKCPIHDEVPKILTKHYHSKQPCPRCANNNKYEIEDLYNKLRKIHKNKYDYPYLKDEYKNNLSEITLLCEYHGEVKQNLSNHMNRGDECKECANKKYSLPELKVELNNKFNNKFKYPYLDKEYVDLSSIITIICPEHGSFKHNIYWHINSINGCIECSYKNRFENGYKGEKIISHILNKNNIKYITQKSFEDCKFINKLYFDFYLPEHNTCIEYDGKQHDNIVELWGGEKDFIKRKQRDNVKNEYCKNNNIILIRIKHDDKIEDRLLEIIKY